MKIKSNIKAGGKNLNHNQTVSRGLRIKSNVKAGTDQGRIMMNHNQTLRGLRIKSNIKAGRIISNHNQTTLGGLRIKSGMKAGGGLRIITRPCAASV